MEIRKIGIAGVGFVGDAVRYGFDALAGRDVSIVCHDPKLPQSRFEDLLGTDCVFLCLPTPSNSDGSCDISILVSVVEKLASAKFSGYTVIKSTTPPAVCGNLARLYLDLNLVTNPEFLTERTARLDFINSTHILIGGTNTKGLVELYERYFPLAEIMVTEAIGAPMMAKYMANTFFATKIALMNEFHAYWERYGGCSWEELAGLLAADPRVGSQHLQVPGPDGQKGFGGHCFPKDLSAAISFMAAAYSESNILRRVQEVNARLRSDIML